MNEIGQQLLTAVKTEDWGEVEWLVDTIQLEDANAPQEMDMLWEPDVKAAINHKDGEGCTPLMHAAARGNMGLFHSLICGGADPSEVDNNRQTALVHAAINGSMEVIEGLIRAGVDPWIKDIYGKTALDYAIIMKHQEAADLIRQWQRRLVDGD